MTPCSLVRPVDFSLPTFVYVCQACLLLPQGCAEPSFIYEVTGEHCCTVMNFGFIATIPQGAFFFISPPTPHPLFFLVVIVFSCILYIFSSDQVRMPQAQEQRKMATVQPTTPSSPTSSS